MKNELMDQNIFEKKQKGFAFAFFSKVNDAVFF